MPETSEKLSSASTKKAGAKDRLRTDEGRNGQDISNGCQRRVFTKRMPSECTAILDETFGAHVFECSLSKFVRIRSASPKEGEQTGFTDLLNKTQCDLRKLGGEKETGGRAESIASGANINVGKERKRLDISILVGGCVGVIDVPLTNGVTLDAAEMDGEFLHCKRRGKFSVRRPLPATAHGRGREGLT
jgi:hypothetical protein